MARSARSTGTLDWPSGFRLIELGRRSTGVGWMGGMTVSLIVGVRGVLGVSPDERGRAEEASDDARGRDTPPDDFGLDSGGTCFLCSS